MDEHEAAFPIADSPSSAVFVTPPALSRWSASLQVLIVCGIPTQVLAFAFLALALGLSPMAEGGGLSFEFIAVLSFVDTALVAVLIRLFLASTHERSADVFIGERPVVSEILRGLAFLPVVFVGVTLLVLAIRAVAPWLHNVETSPFEAFVGTPMQAAIFLVVVVLAGGVREELQRAFILHRFEQRLGGVHVGLVLFSLAFGAFHLDQGYDVAIAICVLGFFWGLAYVRRRSAIMPMVNHASFNAAQVVQIMLARAFTA